VNPAGDETKARKAAKAIIQQSADEIHKKLTGHPTPKLGSLIIRNGAQKPQRFGVIADCLSPFLAERELLLQGMAASIVALKNQLTATEERVARLERLLATLADE